MESTAFNQAGWNPLHLIGMHFTTLHGIYCIQSRHEPNLNDQMMVEYLRHYGIPFTVVATKADKLSKAARGRLIPAICRKLAVQPWEVLQYSAEDGTGREELLELLEM